MLVSNAILDLIFTNVGTIVSKIMVDECFGTSDHSIHRFVLEMPTHQTLQSEYKNWKLNYNRVDWSLMHKHLNEAD